jgi:hypothetical protein
MRKVIMSREVSPIQQGQNTTINDFGRPQLQNHDFKENENLENEIEAANRHPLERHFAPNTARGPLGRNISKSLANKLGIQGE